MGFGVGFGSVFGKTWILIRLVLAGFEFFPISTFHRLNRYCVAQPTVSTGICEMVSNLNFI